MQRLIQIRESIKPFAEGALIGVVIGCLQFFVDPIWATLAIAGITYRYVIEPLQRRVASLSTLLEAVSHYQDAVGNNLTSLRALSDARYDHFLAVAAQLGHGPSEDDNNGGEQSPPQPAIKRGRPPKAQLGSEPLLFRVP